MAPIRDFALVGALGGLGRVWQAAQRRGTP
ncbi:hypothetical protein SAMN02787142_7789 [Burkholderia sp. WP9]|nr:hypothetical protein SAMN02787142_7789 [Burkholderia sp. WP9]